MKISVVVPAYNEEKLIGKCLRSILNQTIDRKEYEIIFIDNNSSDSTSQIAKSLGIKPILYTEKKGAIWAKQYGAKKAKGDIIVITDADAVFENSWLESIVKIFDDKKLMIVGGTVMPTSSNPLIMGIFKLSDYFSIVFQKIGVPFIWGTNMAVRRTAFEKVGGFNTNLKTGDDWELVLRIQKEYGVRSAKYTNRLKVKASPRKQDTLKNFIPYVGIAVINFFSIFVFRKSYTFGKYKEVR